MITRSGQTYKGWVIENTQYDMIVELSQNCVDFQQQHGQLAQEVLGHLDALETKFSST